MKQVLRHILIFLTLTISSQLSAQVQGKFGNTQSSLDVNAALEVESTSKGVLLPRLTTAQQNAMSAPTNGMLIYNTDSACLVVRRAGIWRSLCAANGGEAWSTLGNVGTNANTHFLGTTDNVPLSIRVNNLRSGYIDPSATQSTFFGYRAGINTNPSVAVGNTAIGHQALSANTTGGNNTALGATALNANTTGQNHVALGINTLKTATAATYNVAVGNDAMSNATGGDYNTAVGSSALQSNTTGTNNVALGLFTLQSNTTGTYNVAVGSHTLIGNTTGGGNIGMGFYSLRNNTSGQFNVGIGSGALQGSTTGNSNVGLGFNALAGATNTGSFNVGIGEYAMFRNTSGFDNVGIGRTALSFNTTGQNNVGLGVGAVYANTTGSNNVGLGANALNAALTVSNNTAVGAGSAQFTTGGNNAAFGYNSLNLNTTGTNNVGIGYGAGTTNTTGSNNTLLGYQANVSTAALSNATAIGANATVGASNSLVLGNLVNVGINTGTPQYKLDIDAQTGSSGNPLRLLGLNAGATSDSIISSSAGILRRLSINQILGNAWQLGGNGVTSLQNIGTTSNFALPFITNNVERARITEGGNFGIGTNAPTAKFQITDGTFNLRASELGFQIQTIGNTAWTNLGSPDVYPILQWYNTAGVGMGVINRFGNMGIGTINPTYKLDIDAQTGGTGNPLRLLGLNAGLTTDSLVTSAAGIVRRMHMNNMAWTLTGNSGTTAGTNFVGTTDAQDFVIKAFNTEGLRLYQANNGVKMPGHIAVGANSAINSGALLWPSATFKTLISAQEEITGNVTENFVEGTVSHLLVNHSNNAPSSSFYGLDAAVDIKAGNANSLKWAGGAFGGVQHRGSGAITNTLAFHGNNYNYGSGTITNAYGVYSANYNYSTGNITNQYGGYFQGGNQGAGTVSNYYGLFVNAPENGGGGTLTNVYGLYLQPVTNGSNRYAIYSAGGRSYHADNFGIGTATPQYKLDVDATGVGGNPLRLLGLNTGATSDSIISSASGVLRRLSINQVLGNAWQLGGNNVTANQNLGTTTNFPLPIITNNAERMRITEGGLVGIGTTTPMNVLSVSGVTSNLSSGVLGSFSGLTTATSSNQIALSGGLTVNPSAATSALSMAGVFGTIDGAGANLTNLSLKAVHGEAYYTGTGTVTNMAGVTGNLWNTSSGTITNAYALHAPVTFNTGAGTITNSYGLRVENQTVGVNNFGVYIAGATTRSLHVNTGTSYFGGNVGVNITAPLYKLDIDAQTGSSGNPLRLLGLNAGATSDSIVSSSAGILRRLSINQVLGNAWNILGNAGTVDGTNFIGTTDNVPFNIRVNNQKAGRIDNTLDNTFFGYQAGNVTTGPRNTFLGGAAGLNNTTGQENTAIGHLAFNTNTTGQDNVAVGQDAMRQNTTGSSNVGVGESALESNTIGINNVALGGDAINRSTAASDNIGLGYQALYNQSFANAGTAWSTDNIAIGTFALNNNQPTTNTNGYRNIGIGRRALASNTTGSSNTATGFEAGLNLTTGSNNTFIGYQADANTATLNNATAIGYLAKVNQSNSLILGATGANAVNVGINTTTPQYKLDIDAQTGSTGNPLRLTGLLAGASSDSVLTSASGVVRRRSVSEVLSNAWNINGNSGTTAGTNFVGTTDAQDVVFRAANTEGMRISNTNRYLGIGTTTPLSRLHIDGETTPAITLRGNGTANTNANTQGRIQFYEPATTDWGMVIDFLSPDLANAVPANQNQLRFRSRNSAVETDILVMNQSGNSGFGTNTPQNKLDVEGTLVVGATYSGTNVGPTNGLLVEGSVGIGTTAPNQQLEITAAMRMPATTSSTTGIIYKGTNRFIHDYKPAANLGNNTFIGINAGNFTMTSPTNWLASGNTGVGTNALTALTEGGYNSASGFNALAANTMGSYNTATGSYALSANTTGVGNTAFGNSALQVNSTASSNTAVGNGTLALNTTGAANTAVGESALSKNTTASQNTALGQSAMRDNTTGANNTAVGLSALQANLTGSNNVALGVSTLVNATAGDGNTGLGYNSLSSTTSSNNVAVGFQAGTGTTTGGSNTFIGYNSAVTNITGSNNTVIGFQANVATSALTNATAIGNGAAVDASNKIRLGNTSVTNVETYGSFTTISDKRLKTNINDNFIGLNFIKAVRPVQYELKSQKGIVYDGFVAQEIDSVLTKLNIKSFSGVSKPQNTEGGYYTVSYATFVVPLVNAVKELDALSDKLKVNSDKLAAENAALKAELEKMRQDNAILKASVDKNSQDIEAIKAALVKKQN